MSKKVNSEVERILGEFNSMTDSEKTKAMRKLGEIYRDDLNEKAFRYMILKALSKLESLETRMSAIRKISELDEYCKKPQLIQLTISKCIELLQLKSSEFKKEDNKQFHQFRQVIIRCLEKYGKEEIKVFNELVKHLKNEKIVNTRRAILLALDSIDPLQAINIFFQYIIDDPNKDVRKVIHDKLRARFESTYDWSKVEEYFTDDFLEKVFTHQEHEIKSQFVQTIGNHADPNEKYETYFLKIIQNRNENLNLRKIATIRLGNVGLDDSIIKLTEISKQYVALRQAADSGLIIFADKHKMSKEKLVETFVREPASSSIWLRTFSIVTGALTIILSLVRMLPLSFTDKQITRIGWLIFAFAIITLAFIVIILIPSFSRYFNIRRIRKNVRKNLLVDQ